MTRTSRFDFGSDTAHQWGTKCKLFSLAAVCTVPSTILLCSVLPNLALWVVFHLFVCLSMSRISQKGMDRFGWNLVDRLGVCQGWIDLIVVRIQIRENISNFYFLISVTEGGWRFSFHPSVFVCLSVSRISQKVRNGLRWNLMDRLGVWQGQNNYFGEDPDPDTRIFSFLSDFSPLKDGAKNDIYHDISKSCGRIMTKLGGWVMTKLGGWIR